MVTNHQGRLNRIRKRPGNQRCCDCSEVDPSHASILPAFPILWSDTSSDQIGVLCCQTCSLVHKSVLQRDNEMDIRVIDLQSAELWTDREIQALEAGGNKMVNEVLQKNRSWKTSRPGSSSNFTSREQFCREKYIERRFATSTNDHTNKAPNLDGYLNSYYGPVGDVDVDSELTSSSLETPQEPSLTGTTVSSLNTSSSIRSNHDRGQTALLGGTDSEKNSAKSDGQEGKDPMMDSHHYLRCEDADMVFQVHPPPQLPEAPNTANTQSIPPIRSRLLFGEDHSKSSRSRSKERKKKDAIEKFKRAERERSISTTPPQRTRKKPPTGIPRSPRPVSSSPAYPSASNRDSTAGSAVQARRQYPRSRGSPEKDVPEMEVHRFKSNRRRGTSMDYETSTDHDTSLGVEMDSPAIERPRSMIYRRRVQSSDLGSSLESGMDFERPGSLVHRDRVGSSELGSSFDSETDYAAVERPRSMTDRRRVKSSDLGSSFDSANDRHAKEGPRLMPNRRRVASSDLGHSLSPYSVNRSSRRATTADIEPPPPLGTPRKPNSGSPYSLNRSSRRATTSDIEPPPPPGTPRKPSSGTGISPRGSLTRSSRRSRRHGTRLTGDSPRHSWSKLGMQWSEPSPANSAKKKKDAKFILQPPLS